MNIQEFNLIKNKNYNEYCDYLIKKYDQPLYPYFTKSYTRDNRNSRTEEGLVIHHIKENIEANLSNPNAAKINQWDYQEPHNLCYANMLEHLFLHILISKETDDLLGYGGIVHILETIDTWFEKENLKTWEQNCFSIIEANIDVYEELYNIFNEMENNEQEKSLLFEHNITTYEQMRGILEEDNKVLVIIGTGGGKTTTALEYLRENKYKALVLGHRNIILDSWKGNKNVNTKTYQWFMNNYQSIDWNDYDVLICDEAHHCSSSNRFGEGVKYVIDNKLAKVIGLTAEEKKSDGLKVAEDMFDGNFVKGITVLEGIKEDIIHPFSYVGAYYDTDSIRNEFINDSIDQTLIGELDLALNNTPKLKEIFKKHMPKNKRKGIIFVSNIAAIPEALDIMKDIYPNIECRAIHNNMNQQKIEENKEWFAATDEGYLLSVNMVSEGAHYKGVNTLIMFRKTISPLVFNQQLGRIIALTKFENPNGIVFDLVNNAETVKYGEVLDNLPQEIKKTLIEIAKKNNINKKSEQIIVADYTEDIVNILEKIREINSNWKIKVVCLETGNIFNSITEASKWVNCNPSSITRACNGFQELSGGYHWAKLVEYQTWSEEEKNKYLNTKQKQIKERNKKIICLETKEVFDSDTELSKYLGISTTTISAACLEKINIVSDYHIMFLSNYDELTIEEQNKYINQLPKIKEQIPIICLETEEIFNSITQASSMKNISKTALVNNLKRRSDIAGGYHWMYLGEYNSLNKEEIKQYLNNISKNTGSTKKQVICLETKKVYNSCREADIDIGASLGYVSAVCLGNSLTAKGYHFKFLSDYKKMTEDEILNTLNNKQKRRNSNYKSVICLETKRIYDTAAQAYRETGINNTNISAVCNKRLSTAGGYHWVFLSEYETWTEEQQNKYYIRQE